MIFSEQLKKLRAEQDLTQEQVASKLNVSRQAVSHWENNKNLPDLEMLVNISDAFGISLDQLILGSDGSNDMAEKLIKDGGETRHAKINLISFIVGTILLLVGIGCIWIKTNAVEYIDAAGILHESFFLIPIGMLFMFCGVVVFSVTGIRSILTRCCNHTKNTLHDKGEIMK